MGRGTVPRNNQSGAVALTVEQLQVRTVPSSSLGGAGGTPITDPAILATLSGLQFPSERPKYYMSLGVSEYSRIDLMNVARLTPFANVILPLPKQLVNKTEVRYEETPLGSVLGGLGNEGLKWLNSNKPGAAKNQQTSGAGPEGSPMPKGLDLAAAVAAPFAGDLASITASIAGYSPNQFMTILLKGPSYRKHVFNWKFSPDTEAESKTLDKIIRLLHEWSSPGLSTMGALFTFPRVFQINFTPNEKLLYSFKPAVLESITVDYTPNDGASFYRASASGLNAPESVAISMQFLELEFWLSGRNDFGTNGL